MKKYIVIPVLFLVCGFSFTQNIKVIGIIPAADSGKTYQLQIGAFRLAANVNNAIETLKKNGFVPQCEKRGDLVRVFVVANAHEVRSAIDRLGSAGFKEVLIREYAVKTEVVTPCPKEEKAPIEIKEPIEAKAPVETKEPIPDSEPAFDTELPDHDLMHFDE